MVTAIVLAGLAGSMAVATASPTTATNPALPAGRAAIDNATPGWAVAAADQGQTNTNTQLDAQVYLQSKDPAGLSAFISAVADPHSPQYQHYLTPAQYQARFGPSQSEVNSVSSWLTSAGLTVTGTNSHAVSVRGSVATAQRAFGVAEHNFSLQGKTYYAPAGTVNVPTAVASSVLGVVGLDDAPNRNQATSGQPTTTAAAKPAASTPEDTLPGPAPLILDSTPCSTYYGQNMATTEPTIDGKAQPWKMCGYTPAQLRSAYGLASTNTGSGQTVAVFGDYSSPTITADLNQYARNYGLPALNSGGPTFTQVLASSWNSVSNCDPYSWYQEESMDIDSVRAMAPQANIVYVGAASCNNPDLFASLDQIVDQKLATVVSASWGDAPDPFETPANVAAYQQAFKQGVAEGIGFYFAVGDCGYFDPNTSCGNGAKGPAIEYPGDDPYVTSVGGTSLAIGQNGKTVWQSTWGVNSAALSADGKSWTPTPGTGYPGAWVQGGGGGTSTLFTQPSWQNGVVPTSLSEALPNGTTSTTPMRVSPDVAMDADPDTGILVGQTQTFADGSVKYYETPWGGTSVSCPLFAGLQADAQQISGSTIGFADPALYSRYGTPAYQQITDDPLGQNTWLGYIRNFYANSSDPTSAQTTDALSAGQDGLLHGSASGFNNA
ncbi:MAG TPA: S53 family peptidase, partial [Pseudonocardiaceae bacterium]|nr:S53 family peptidase [Pseudonocardiaceae bacterium]